MDADYIEFCIFRASASHGVARYAGKPTGQQMFDSMCLLSAPETFMPAMQEQPFAKAHQIEKKNAERRQQREAGKHGGNLKPVARFNNTPR